MENDDYSNISIRLPKKDPNILKIYKLLFKLFFFASVSIFRSTNRYFRKNIKIFVLENSCLKKWIHLIYFGYSGPKSSEVARFIFAVAMMLK